MLYYRFKNKETLVCKKSLALLLVFCIWLFWFLSEFPFYAIRFAGHPAPNSIISKGNVILSTPLLNSDIETVQAEFLEPAVGVLTSSYGERWGRTHEGIDIGGSHGSDIVASNDGNVLMSRYVDGYGNFIELDHGNGFKTSYGHCHELFVSEGESVTKGQVIASMGNTGNSTGPHLHFEIHLNGEPQNPLNYVIY